MESLERRYLLSADGLDFAARMPDVCLQLHNEIMDRLQDRAAQFGVNSTDLLRIPVLRHPWDVNWDGFISPIDPLMVINRLNQFGSERLPEGMSDELVRLDVNADELISPLDALLMINGLNGGHLPTGHWWEGEADVRDVVAGALESVQEILFDRGLDAVADEIRDVQEIVLAHLDDVRTLVATHLAELGYEGTIEDVLSCIDEVGGLIDEHMDSVGELVGQHLDSLWSDFYDSLATDEGLPPARIDAMLDRVVLETRHRGWEPDGDTVAWHVDYVHELIDRHADYLREGRDAEQIVDLVGSHIDYVVDLLDIHDVHVGDMSDVGDILDHVRHVIDWVDDYGAGAHQAPSAEGELVPVSVRRHLHSVWDHVGYVRELVDMHDRESGGGDLAALITDHFDHVRQLLERHGVSNQHVWDIIDDVLNGVFRFWR